MSVARRGFRQTRPVPGETDTAGYALIGADATHGFTHGRVEGGLFAHTRTAVRVSPSGLRAIAPFPGGSLLRGMRARFWWEH